MLRQSLTRLSRTIFHPRSLTRNLQPAPRPVSPLQSRSMARKSARALAAAEASSSHSAEDDTLSGSLAVSDLSPKSCLTCGRVITPRAKWAKDWAGIKYCSDRCRSTRPGRITVSFSTQEDVSALAEYDGVTRHGEEEVIVDVETFVEAVLLELAGAGTATLEDVQAKIQDLLKAASIQTEESSQGDAESDDDHPGAERTGSGNPNAGDTHPLWKALDSPPGLRERIRRAARRLALGITHDSDAKQTSITTTEAGQIELIQKGKPLRTVQELSFAKGVIHIRRKKS